MSSDFTNTMRRSPSNTSTSCTDIRSFTQCTDDTSLSPLNSSPSTLATSVQLVQLFLLSQLLRTRVPKTRNSVKQNGTATTFPALSFPQYRCPSSTLMNLAPRSVQNTESTARNLYSLVHSRRKALRRHPIRNFYKSIKMLGQPRVH